MAGSAPDIVIVGGGSAGWITAGLLAARARASGNADATVTVIEAPDIPIIGVGEGTWPSMRSTLHAMGVREQDFIRACHASFKQGSKFCRWRRDEPDDFYYHPFDPPEGAGTAAEGNIVAHWLVSDNALSFSNVVCAQESLCEAHRAPKNFSSPDYAGFTNYGYHLDAGAFSVFLRDHCTANLGVRHVADRVTGVVAGERGDIHAVQTSENGKIAGTLFVDCTGFRALLLGQHYGVGLMSRSDILFPDTALAVQVPYGNGDAVQSTTVSTAQPAGWIWDVSLSSRRGVGHVFCSRYMDDTAATECLRSYLDVSKDRLAELGVRRLEIGSGYRETFWIHNCVAVGLSAGFLEPLEASALMLIETTANMIAGHVFAPGYRADQAAMDVNTRLHAIWENIIHFLKLHYCLSERNEPFWQDNRAAASIPPALAADMVAWQHSMPGMGDAASQALVFPPASYQYVLYGMQSRSADAAGEISPEMAAKVQQQMETVSRSATRLHGMLPDNRTLLDYLNGRTKSA